MKNRWFPWMTGLVFLLLVAFQPLALKAQLWTGKNFGFSNRLSIQTEWYEADGIDPRQFPFAWTVSGNPTVTLFGQEVPFSILVSNYNSEFHQPFNHYGISPKYKWAQLHLGYRSLRFSPFTLAGHRMLGAGMELTPGKFHIGFFYGHLRKAVEFDTTANGQIPGVFQLSPSFSRTGYGAKIGYGSKDKHYVGFSYLRAGDNKNSLVNIPSDVFLSPAENTALGISFQLRFFKKLYWSTEAAASVFTRDTEASELEIEDNFWLFDLVEKLHNPKESSQAFWAGESSLEWRDRAFSLGATYRRVDPGYQSMGAYYLQTDLEQFTFGPSFRINNKFSFRGKIGFQRDNVRNIKSRTTERIVGNAFVNWNVSKKFGLSAQYTNFGITQNPLSPSITDTTLLEQVNQSISLFPRLMLTGQTTTNMFQLSATYNELADRSPNAFAGTELTALNLGLVHSISWLTPGLSLTTSVFQNQTKTAVGEASALGASLGLHKSIFKKRSSLNFSSGYYRNKFEGQSNGYTLRISGDISFPIGKSQSLSAGLRFLQNESENEALNKSFREWRLRSGYTYTFSTKKGKNEKQDH